MEILPLYSSLIQAGFPSPADDHIHQNLNLHEYLIKHPAATFFVRVTGDSMTGSGIFDGDILIVDRSLEAKHNKVVIAVVNGDMTVKRLYKRGHILKLLPDNPSYKPLIITEASELHIWGVVSHVIHQV